MARIHDFIPQDDDSMFAHANGALVIHNPGLQLVCEQEQLNPRSDVAKRLDDLETKFEVQREIDRQEKAKEKELEHILRAKDRQWFTTVIALHAALLGGLVIKMLDTFLK